MPERKVKRRNAQKRARVADGQRPLGGGINRREYIQCINQRNAACSHRQEHFECDWQQLPHMSTKLTCVCVPIAPTCDGGLSKLSFRTWRSSLDKTLLKKMRSHARIDRQELESEGTAGIVDDLEEDNEEDLSGVESGEQRDERDASGAPDELESQGEGEALDFDATGDSQRDDKMSHEEREGQLHGSASDGEHCEHIAAVSEREVPDMDFLRQDLRVETGS